MLASIHPLGERARNRRWGVTVSAYLVGSVAGAAVVGASLGLAGSGLQRLVPPLPGWAPAITVAVVVLGLAFDLRVGGIRLPTVRRQVNKDWLDEYRGWVYGLGFGFQLGSGVATVVNTAAVYVMLVVALLSGSVLAGLAIGFVFGLVRGTVIFAVSTVRRPDQLRAALRHMESWGPWSQRIGILTQALVVLIVGASVLRP